MQLIIDKLAKQRIVTPLRNLGLFVARHWPYPVRATLSDKTSMWVELRSSVGRAILVKGEFDHAVWLAIEPHLQPGFVFLDVGANVGYYSMLASTRVGTSGRVHAFEIDPRPLRCLRRNSAECRNHNITIHEFAVGDLVGHGVLVAASDCGHSTVRHDGSGMKVEMLTLDHWMESPGAPNRIDVIKLDIEGGELAALEGARKLISKHRPLIVCEALDESEEKECTGARKLLGYFASINYSTHFADGVYTPTIVAGPQ